MKIRIWTMTAQPARKLCPNLVQIEFIWFFYVHLMVEPKFENFLRSTRTYPTLRPLPDLKFGSNWSGQPDVVSEMGLILAALLETYKRISYVNQNENRVQILNIVFYNNFYLPETNIYFRVQNIFSHKRSEQYWKQNTNFLEIANRQQMYFQIQERSLNMTISYTSLKFP